jgi:predicted transcriptional regulator
MKTIAQIAREIGVSKQAVHKRINKEPLKSSLQGLMETIDNALHINIDGEKLILSAFNGNLVDELLIKVDEQPTNIDEPTTELIRALKDQITTLNAQNKDLRQQLNEERSHSRKQSNEILQLAQQGQKLAENAQTLHALENVKPQQLANSNKKKGLFNKIFSRSENID